MKFSLSFYESKRCFVFSVKSNRYFFLHKINVQLNDQNYPWIWPFCVVFFPMIICKQAKKNNLSFRSSLLSSDFLTFAFFHSLTGSYTSSLNRIRTRLRRWGKRLNRFRSRKAKPQPVEYATKQNLLTAVVTSVHIAKRNSVLGAEDECLCGQTR